MWYTLCEFCENRARDTSLQDVSIPHFGQIWVKISVFRTLKTEIFTPIWVKISVFRVLRPFIAPMGVKFGMEDPHRCNVSPLRGEKPKNRPLSKLNTGGLHCAQCFALCAMVPLINCLIKCLSNVDSAETSNLRHVWRGRSQGWCASRSRWC